ncbi:MAG: ABC transporter permease [Deltaproteobacteria bacterium]|nr:ABC transporter permease [Deltaproteobacteria bacterium]MBW2396633.1 ABC transporter permease [Deltaproteobacteria bacterium]
MRSPLDFLRTVARLVRADVTKLSRYWVVLAGFVAVVVLAVSGTMVFHRIEQAANVTSNSGYDFALAVMDRLVDVSLPIVYVLVCILFAIDVSNSTVKYILTRPVTRMELLVSKYVTAFGMVTLNVALLWTVALSGGAAFYGLGDLTENGYVIFSGGYVFGQFALGTFFLLIALGSVAAMGVAVSTFSSTMGGAIIIGLIFFFMLELLAVIPTNLGLTLSLGGEAFVLPFSSFSLPNQPLIPLGVLGDLTTGIAIESWWIPPIQRMLAVCGAYLVLFLGVSAFGIRKRDFTL